MSRRRSFKKQTGYKRCSIPDCNKRAEVEMTKNEKPFPNCWMHAYIILQQSYAQLSTSKELFDRIPDNCYKCSPASLALEHADFLIRGLRDKLKEATE